MNLSKHLEYFDPHEVTESIHIIGCGATGSTLAEMLTRLGLQNFYLWDKDEVAPHNLANQMFKHANIGMLKAAVVANMMEDINPDLKQGVNIRVKLSWYENQPLSGWVFLAVDNIDTRRKIVELHMHNPNIRGMFDFRLGLMDGQHYAAKWDNDQDKERLLAQMQFTHEEAKANTPLSACGTSLCVVPGVRLIIAAGVANFMNMAQNKPYKRIILSDAQRMELDSF